MTPTNEERLVCLNLQNTTNKREEPMQCLEKQLHSENNGKALVTSSEDIVNSKLYDKLPI